MKTRIIKYFISTTSFVILLYLLNSIEIYNFLQNFFISFLANMLSEFLGIRISPSDLKTAMYFLIFLAYLRFRECSTPVYLSLSIVFATLLFRTRYLEALPSFNIRLTPPFRNSEIYAATVSGFILVNILIFARYFDRMEKMAYKQLEMGYEKREVENVNFESVKYALATVAVAGILSYIILSTLGIVPIFTFTYPLIQTLGLLIVLLSLLYLQLKI